MFNWFAEQTLRLRPKAMLVQGGLAVGPVENQGLVLSGRVLLKGQTNHTGSCQGRMGTDREKPD